MSAAVERLAAAVAEIRAESASANLGENERRARVNSYLRTHTSELFVEARDELARAIRTLLFDTPKVYPPMGRGGSAFAIGQSRTERATANARRVALENNLAVTQDAKVVWATGDALAAADLLQNAAAQLAMRDEHLLSQPAGFLHRS